MAAREIFIWGRGYGPGALGTKERKSSSVVQRRSATASIRGNDVAPEADIIYEAVCTCLQILTIQKRSKFGNFVAQITPPPILDLYVLRG